MATTYSMNLRDLGNPQYTAVTGRKQKIPYSAYLTAMGQYARDSAKQDTQDALREKELQQNVAQFDATQALEKEKMSINADQTQKATALSGAQTAVMGAALADKAGLIDLKAIAGQVAPRLFPAQAAATATASAEAAMAAESTAAAETSTATYAALDGATASGEMAGGIGGVTGAAETGLAAEGAAAGTATAGTGLWGMAGGSGAAPAGVYALPALAGYVAPKILNAVHEDSTENLGHNISLGLVRDEKTAGAIGSGASGAAAGALAGAALTSWSGPGAIVGAALGGLVGAVSDGCIIVTACTSADSDEVNVARQYRDKFLTPEQLRGYYMIAEKIVPLIVRFPLVRRIVKRFLVDNLVVYGRHALAQIGIGRSLHPELLTPGPAATIITRVFLALCRVVGNRKTSFVRCNGEIV